MFENLASSLSWFWTSNNTQNVPSSSAKTRHNDKRKSGPSRVYRHSSKVVSGEPVIDGYFPGLVNISGTYCFMNSTIQALSSLSYLQPQIDAIHAKAEALDVPTPVIDVLRDLFHRLNTPNSSYTTIRPVEVIDVLSAQPDGRSNALLNSREHQDAQELFQLLSECIKSEMASIEKERAKDRGFGDLSQAADANRDIGKSVFDGLTANRRSCVVCGYTEAVMHFSFDNWQLAVPRLASSCLLEDCLEDYTRLEVLNDCICRRCSVNATHRRLLNEIESLQTAIQNTEKPSPSKKRRLKEVKKMEAKVKTALDEGRIEEDLKDVRMEKVFGVSTKQAMIARPPPILALHLNRSVHFSHYTSKNNIRVLFPEVLDLTPFTTSGNLSTVPTSSLSSPSPDPPRSTTPTPDTHSAATAAQSRTIYRLAAVVCHYGAHSFGHYICYRRKPLYGNKIWKPPRLVFSAEKQRENMEQSKAELEKEMVEGGDADVSSISDADEHAGFWMAGGGKAKTKTTTNKLIKGGGKGGKSRKHNQHPHQHPQQNGTAVPSDTSVSASEALADYVWEDDDPSSTGPGTGRGWLRISDDSVGECGIESVLAEGSGAFMLYYERAVISSGGAETAAGAIPIPTKTPNGPDCPITASPSLSSTTASSSPPPIYPYAGRIGALASNSGYGIGTASPLSSEETLRPGVMVMGNGFANGSLGSLVSLASTSSSMGTSGSPGSLSGGLGTGTGTSPPSQARIIQSVAAGRGRERERSMSGTPESVGGGVGKRRASSVSSPSRISPPPTTSGLEPIRIPEPDDEDGEDGDGDEGDLDTIPSAMSSSAPSIISMSPSPSPSSPNNTHNHNHSHIQNQDQNQSMSPLWTQQQQAPLKA